MCLNTTHGGKTALWVPLRIARCDRAGRDLLQIGTQTVDNPSIVFRAKHVNGTDFLGDTAMAKASSPEEGMASLIRNLEEKTGKSIDVWIATARATGQTKHGQIVAILKKDHGLSHGYANQIAPRALAASATSTGSDVDPIDALYSVRRAGLRPIHDALIAAIKKFGGDVELSPKKSYVSVRRSKQFALIQPSTATRVDVGLILKNVPAKGRLEESGSFNAMFTHRVRLASLADVDAELIGWLRQAYEAA